MSGVCFEKKLDKRAGQTQPLSFVRSSLLDAVISLMLERNRDVLSQGAVLIDPTDPGKEPRVLFYLEQIYRMQLAARWWTAYHFTRKSILWKLTHRARPMRRAVPLTWLSSQPQADELDALQRNCKPIGGDGWVGSGSNRLRNKRLNPAHLNRVRERREELIAKTFGGCTGTLDQRDQLLGSAGTRTERARAGGATQRQNQLS